MTLLIGFSFKLPSLCTLHIPHKCLCLGIWGGRGGRDLRSCCLTFGFNLKGFNYCCKVTLNHKESWINEQMKSRWSLRCLWASVLFLPKDYPCRIVIFHADFRYADLCHSVILGKLKPWASVPPFSFFPVVSEEQFCRTQKPDRRSGQLCSV